VRPPERVGTFALRVLAWLAPAFALWYLVSPWHERPAAWLANLMLGVFPHGMSGTLEFGKRLVTFVTDLQARTADGQAGLVEIEVNPLLYTYGSALFLALMLASGARWTRLAIGLAVLLPFHAWGIAFDVIGQVLRMDSAIAAQAGLTGWRAEAGALGYQLGSLVFPALAPIALWVLLERAFVERIARTRLAR
jgi:hypothetical protein